MSKHETFPEAAERFMEKYEWSVFCTPTWRYPVGEDRAKKDVREFVCKFGEQAYAYVKCERGPQGGLIHAHAAIGGLNPIAKNRGDQLWPYGIIHWEPYRRGGGAARYLWKNAEEAPGEFIGIPRRLYARKRGRRGKGSSSSPIGGQRRREVAVSHAVDVVELQALSDHPRIAEADERLAMLGQQRADAEVDLRLLQQKRERKDAEVALRLNTGSKIPPAIRKQLYVEMEQTVHTAQLCWVLDTAIERATAARDALVDGVLREVLAQLQEQRRNAIVDLDRALSVAAEANERVVSIQDALSRLGRQVFGSGTVNSAGIGTRTGAAVITAYPLPDLASWELSLRTTRIQPETRLSVWRDHASRVLGIKLSGSGEG